MARPSEMYMGRELMDFGGTVNTDIRWACREYSKYALASLFSRHRSSVGLSCWSKVRLPRSAACPAARLKLMLTRRTAQRLLHNDAHSRHKL